MWRESGYVLLFGKGDISYINQGVSWPWSSFYHKLFEGITTTEFQGFSKYAKPFWWWHEECSHGNMVKILDYAHDRKAIWANWFQYI